MTMKGFVNFVFSLLLCCSAASSNGQIVSVAIGINGLTCSQCSWSVEMQLRKLPFVKEVRMDLEQTEGTLFFKDKKSVDIQAIAQAVKDAGFSVRFLQAAINKEQISISPEGCFKLNGDVYTILPPLNLTTDKWLSLQFIGKEYLPKSELKQYNLTSAAPCKGAKLYVTAVSKPSK